MTTSSVIGISPSVRHDGRHDLPAAPGQGGVAVSRRIEDEPQRESLIALGENLLAQEAQNLPRGAGIIFRTAAQGASLDELALDVRMLGAEIGEQRGHEIGPESIAQHDPQPADRM